MYVPKPIAGALFFIFLGMLNGCASFVAGSAASLGVAAMEERTFKAHAKDTAVATKIRFNLVEASEKFITNVGVEVYEGKVLITGVVKNEAMRAQALKLIWKTDGVKDVYNELQVGNSGVRDLVKDGWVTAQLQSKITFDKDVLAINYSIETVNGTVYLIGIAQSQPEIDRVIAHARTLSYVKRVISHVRVIKAPP